jgi:glycosyltransferase involved in cell wall biosynthesis
LAYYKKATAITAISKSSKKDLLKFFPDIPASRVTVIHLGTNPLHYEGNPSKKIEKMAAKPYLLFVGGIDIRKNIVGLLKAFYELKPTHPDLQLITVGKEFELKDRLDDLGWFTILNSQPEYAKDVIIPGFLSSADLHYLYQKAAAFVFASRYEGFGLPVLEAMQAGCPVVAYDNSSIPEVAGSAALLVKDGHDLAPAISKLLDNPKLRKELIAKGYEQAAGFSWDDTAKKTLDLLHKVSN